MGHLLCVRPTRSKHGAARASANTSPYSPETLPPSVYTVLRAPAPSGLPGASMPGPGGTTPADNYDQALLDQYDVTLFPDLQEYFASGSLQAKKDAECLKRLLLSPRGIERTVRADGSAGLQLRVCATCQQGLKRQHKKPPTFVIANKFLIGQPRSLSICNPASSTCPTILAQLSWNSTSFDLIRPN